jgi:hypothetical protein
VTRTENTTAARSVRLLGAIAGVVALLSMAIVIALMRYDTLSMRVAIVSASRP